MAMFSVGSRPVRGKNNNRDTSSFARRTLLKAVSAAALLTALGFSTFAQGLMSAADAATFQKSLGVREVLTANRTYYVRTDGSDANTGLANTSGGAFLTVTKAVNTALALDMSIYGVTINVGAGAFSETVSITGNGNCRLTIAGAGYASTTIGGAGGGFVIQKGCDVTLQDFTVSGAGAVGIWGRFGAFLRLAGTIQVGGNSARMIGWDTGCYLASTTGNTILVSGNSPALFIGSQGATGTINSSTTVKTTTAVSITNVVNCSDLADLVIYPTWDTSSGAVTGQKYSVTNNGVLNTIGTSAGIPGTGTTVNTGGQVS